MKDLKKRKEARRRKGVLKDWKRSSKGERPRAVTEKRRRIGLSSSTVSEISERRVKKRGVGRRKPEWKERYTRGKRKRRGKERFEGWTEEKLVKDGKEEKVGKPWRKRSLGNRLMRKRRGIRSPKGKRPVKRKKKALKMYMRRYRGEVSMMMIEKYVEYLGEIREKRGEKGDREKVLERKKSRTEYRKRRKLERRMNKYGRRNKPYRYTAWRKEQKYSKVHGMTKEEKKRYVERKKRNRKRIEKKARKEKKKVYKEREAMYVERKEERKEEEKKERRERWRVKKLMWKCEKRLRNKGVQYVKDEEYGGIDEWVRGRRHKKDREEMAVVNYNTTEELGDRVNRRRLSGESKVKGEERSGKWLRLADWMLEMRERDKVESRDRSVEMERVWKKRKERKVRKENGYVEVNKKVRRYRGVRRMEQEVEYRRSYKRMEEEEGGKRRLGRRGRGKKVDSLDRLESLNRMEKKRKKARNLERGGQKKRKVRAWWHGEVRKLKKRKKWRRVTS